MNRKQLIREIADAEKRVAKAKAKIVRQRQIISDLVLSGGDFASAVALTRTLLEGQHRHELHHHCLALKLARANKKPRAGGA